MAQVLYQDGATPWMYDMAGDIIELLDVVYPGQNWSVRVYGDNTGGGYFLQLLDFEGKNYGINQPHAHRLASASELRADVIRKGGELLERCNLARRARTDPSETIKKMDGVPDAHQPLEYRRKLEEDAIKKAVEKALADGKGTELA